MTANWINQSIWTGDNLDIMRGMNSDSVDMIYHDPPFNSKADYPNFYNLLHTVRGLHGDSMMNYLIYMAIRLIEMKRLLKSTGSIFMHCDDHAELAKNPPN